MSGVAFHVLLAGVVGTVVGLILQAIGQTVFSRFKGDDTKDLASVVGFWVSAIFGIAVGLIFASTAAHLMEAKANVLEEARLMATLYVLAADSADQVNTRTRSWQDQLDATHEVDRSNGRAGWKPVI